ncbi:hypothetical protein AA0311_2168 [Asaia bogorensis NBRC 16594]|uniref:Uncharacterized protein n=1 Tax=Asaia bogorensis NBRC 16594 TaxID=1231624 RepID=A0AAN4R044_9PROT|nr:hypothetical protein AA0311_2168 [Asaia bogorensis NBRC 16594]GEL52296.1 hypothetical protein ABO01nite_03030 [Asaia bogorensis NBRC 16594]
MAHQAPTAHGLLSDTVIALIPSPGRPAARKPPLRLQVFDFIRAASLNCMIGGTCDLPRSRGQAADLGPKIQVFVDKHPAAGV